MNVALIRKLQQLSEFHQRAAMHAYRRQLDGRGSAYSKAKAGEEKLEHETTMRTLDEAVAELQRRAS